MAEANVAWRVAAASVQGVNHRRTGQPCQDAHHWWQDPQQGVLVAAVADGSGSVPLAEIGSAVAAREAVVETAARLGRKVPQRPSKWQALLTDALHATREAVKTAAARRARHTDDLATTLLLAVATAGQVAVAQVGDGAIVARRVGGRLQALTRPPVVEQANESTFLTTTGWRDEVQLAVLGEPVTGLVLFTDGLQQLALSLPGGAPHPPFFAPLFQMLTCVPERERAQQNVQGFLESPPLAMRTHDDLTLLLAMPEASC
jgi:hypothetical protein